MNIPVPRITAVLLLVFLLPCLVWGVDAYLQGDNVMRWSTLWAICR